jgi:hypothetical protein
MFEMTCREPSSFCVFNSRQMENWLPNTPDLAILLRMQSPSTTKRICHQLSEEARVVGIHATDGLRFINSNYHVQPL